MKYPERSSLELSGSDPLDAFIGRTLKIWINAFRRPGENEKARLLREAAVMEIKKNWLLAAWLFATAFVKWIFENLLIGSADQPMIYSLSVEHVYSKRNSLNILMAKRMALDSYPMQLGVACLIN
jgi:hypothetical protein